MQVRFVFRERERVRERERETEGETDGERENTIFGGAKLTM